MDVVRNLKVFDPFLISHLIALSAAQLIRSESISFSGQQIIPSWSFSIFVILLSFLKGQQSLATGYSN